ncbi:MAG: sensor histidine kinase [Nocardioides sp.]
MSGYRLPVGSWVDRVRNPPSALVQHYRSYYLAAVLVFRGVSGIPPMMILAGEYGAGRLRAVMLVWLVAVMISLLSAPWIVGRRSIGGGRVVIWLLVDTLIAISLNLWAASRIPGSFNDPYHDLFFFWYLGTVTLWLVWFGLGVGVVFCLLSIPLQIAATMVASADPWTESISMIAGRTVWLLVGAVCGALLHWVINTTAAGVRAEAMRVGHKSARIQALREVHDTALQTLEAIGLMSGDENRPAADRLATVNRAARRQASEIRAALATYRDDDPHMDALAAIDQTVRDLLDVLESAGVRLSHELRHTGPVIQLPQAEGQALCQGIKEALNNVVKHAGAHSAVVETLVRHDRLEVRVGDDGRGFDPAYRPGFGIQYSLRQRLEDVGGSVEIASGPRQGTVVRLSVPRQRSEVERIVRGVYEQGS